jgi:tetratricopeptide (TPR) repeat protein
MAINVDKMRTPQFIFFIYSLAAILVVMIYKFIFPGSEAPLVIYSRNWRMIQGIAEVFNLFPAIAFSGLVIPFGIALIEENYKSFSDIFFKRFFVSIVTVIFAAVVYGVIFFLAYPMVVSYKENLRYSGDIYRLAKKNAQECKEAEEWFEASQFLNICDHVWYKSPELNELRDEIAINLQEDISIKSEERSRARSALTADRRGLDIIPLSEDQKPVDATQAITMSREAFNDKRYYDSHWLANLGTRLAEKGSVEAANAVRLASEAWNMIASLAPNAKEMRLYELFNLKVSGYQSMEMGDWIRAFYIFQELLTYTPDDPDTKNFLAVSEKNAKEAAFFIDEMELSLGNILSGALFSLPSGDGRAVLRFNNLTTLEDAAYGIGFEYMEFNVNMTPKTTVTSRYAKLTPFTLNGKPQVLVLTHALDRFDENNDFKGEWILGGSETGGIFLDASFEDLILISDVRRGLTNLRINELFAASKKLENQGYISQIFQAEILNRLGSVMYFLPMAIFVIVIAWRYRAKEKPRYLFILLLPVLPVVFHGFVFLYRSVINTLGIWLVLSLGFTAALIVFIAAVAVTLFISLVSLSAQHS